jgi:hypothetical protein
VQARSFCHDDGPRGAAICTEDAARNALNLACRDLTLTVERPPRRRHPLVRHVVRRTGRLQ